ncbi:MAG: MBL fold metallo-hydrolase [Myxococcota bacterium]
MQRFSVRFAPLALFFVVSVACSSPEGETLAAGQVVSVVHSPASVNAFIIDLGDGTAALIDSGVEPEAGPLLGALETLGLAVADIAAVFFTHGHEDHVAGALAFPDARRFALGAESELIAGRQNPERPFPSFGDPEETGVEVTDVLEDGAVVPLGNTSVEVFAVPGHTEGSAAYLVHGVLFLGDTASRKDESTMEGATWIFSRDPDESAASLASLAARLEPRATDVTTLAFGHSPALEEGLTPLLDFAAEVELP